MNNFSSLHVSWEIKTPGKVLRRSTGGISSSSVLPDEVHYDFSKKEFRCQRFCYIEITILSLITLLKNINHCENIVV